VKSEQDKRILFLAPLMPSLELQPFIDALARSGWQRAWTSDHLEIPRTSSNPEASKNALGGSSAKPHIRGSGSRTKGRLVGQESLGGSGQERNRQESRIGSSSGEQIQLREVRQSTDNSNDSAAAAVTSKTSEGACRQSEPTKVLEPTTLSEPSESMEPADSPFENGWTDPPEGSQPHSLESSTSKAESVSHNSWPEPKEGPVSSILFRKRGENAALLLILGAFADCAHRSEAGLAMAGTATEQMVRVWGFGRSPRGIYCAASADWVGRGYDERSLSSALLCLALGRQLTVWWVFENVLTGGLEPYNRKPQALAVRTSPLESGLLFFDCFTFL
jgi:hypothetical protein